MTRFVLAAFFLFTIGPLSAQEEVRIFDISAAGITIGEMTVTREVRDTLTHYSLRSAVSFWFFTHVKLDYNVHSVFYRDHLISSTVTTHTNKGDYKSSVQWNKDHYDVNADAYKYKNTEIIVGSIQTNAARMYFEEPVGMKRALADSYGVLAPLDYIDNAYALDVMGKINHYHFSGGKFTRAEIYHSVKNFEITPRKK